VGRAGHDRHSGLTRHRRLCAPIQFQHNVIIAAHDQQCRRGDLHVRIGRGPQRGTGPGAGPEITDPRPSDMLLAGKPAGDIAQPVCTAITGDRKKSTRRIAANVVSESASTGSDTNTLRSQRGSSWSINTAVSSSRMGGPTDRSPEGPIDLCRVAYRETAGRSRGPQRRTTASHLVNPRRQITVRFVESGEPSSSDAAPDLTDETPPKRAMLAGVAAVAGTEYLLRTVLLPVASTASAIHLAIGIEWGLTATLLLFWVPRVERSRWAAIGLGPWRSRYLWLGAVWFLAATVVSAVVGEVFDAVGLDSLADMQDKLSTTRGRHSWRWV
jgi:hypothetical protein